MPPKGDSNKSPAAGKLNAKASGQVGASALSPDFAECLLKRLEQLSNKMDALQTSVAETSEQQKVEVSNMKDIMQLREDQFIAVQSRVADINSKIDAIAAESQGASGSVKSTTRDNICESASTDATQSALPTAIENQPSPLPVFSNQLSSSPLTNWNQQPYKPQLMATKQPPFLPTAWNQSSQPPTVPSHPPSAENKLDLPTTESSQTLPMPAIAPNTATSTSACVHAPYSMPYMYRPKLVDLPEFSGTPENWPTFLSAFRQSTQYYNYSDLDNSFRLQKCLKGQAKETVNSLLMHPENTPRVIEELNFRFGRPEILIKSQLAQVSNIQPLEESRIDLLIPFSTKVNNLVAFLESAGGYSHLSNPVLLEELVCKLTIAKRLDWAQHTMFLGHPANVKDFSEWLSQIAKLVALISVEVPANKRDKKYTKSNVLLHTAGVLTMDKCQICNGSHQIQDCNLFKGFSSAERWRKVKEMGACFACLKCGHRVINCKRRKTCGVNNCRKMHNAVLHEDLARTSGKMNASSIDERGRQKAPAPVLTFNSSAPEVDRPVLFRVLPVKLYGPKRLIQTFAILDEGSSVTMVDEGLAEDLGLSGSDEALTLQWFGDVKTEIISKVVSMQISGVNRNSRKFKLSNVHTITNLILPSQSMPSNDISNYARLKGLPLPNYSNAVPKVLIGIDNASLGVSLKSVECSESGPIAAKTRLGWVIYGPLSSRTVVRSMNVLHISIRDKINAQPWDNIHKIVTDYFDTENFGTRSNATNIESMEDTRARQILKSTTKRVGNRYETGLLWKTEDTKLPSSFSMAMRRLHSIERKMQSDPEFAAKYESVISGYIAKGYARKLTRSEAAQQRPNTWFLPHFGVINPNKPNKLRLVFDAAAEVDGVSLNSALVKGPDMNQPLQKILFAFRQGAVGVCADIAEMFHQINIRQKDQDAQRFLWRGNDSTREVDVYVMMAMIFGATCSPCIAQYIKNRNAVDAPNTSAEVIDAIHNKHYVDDYVASFKNAEEAIRITTAVRNVHKYGGFDLRHFVSNYKEVQNYIQHDSAQCMVNMNKANENPEDKVLGMYWDTVNDNFVFQLRFHRVSKEILELVRPPTKREALRIVMSIFDRYGFVANLVIHAKLMLQQIWKVVCDWDEHIPAHIYGHWIQWQNDLQRVKLLAIPRCYSAYFLSASRIELHTFVDASEVAFAAVSYWRIESSGNDVTVSFVTGKTKCAPLKILLIPRLELQAAVLGVRLKNAIIKSHDIRVDECFFWTDSRTVLLWIKSDHRKYKPFVAHRVAEIIENSSPEHWCWLPSKSNVADDAIRATTPVVFDPNSRWLTGPQFLLEHRQGWPQTHCDLKEYDIKDEIRAKYPILLTTVSCKPLRGLINVRKFSNYFKLVRTISWAMRFIRNCRAKGLDLPKIRGELLASEISHGERILFCAVQEETYKDELGFLKNGKNVPKSSDIYKLTPHLGSDGLLKVNGRINASSEIPFAARNPIILPKTHDITKLIVHYYHKQFHHQNQETIVCELRQRFWIPHLRVIVRRAKLDCQKCKNDSAVPSQPLMGSVPIDRVTRSSVRSRTQDWIILDRFKCPLEDVMKKDNDKIHAELSKFKIEWVFNTPSDPSSGGCWERLIRSVKRVLQYTLSEKYPKEHTLMSVLAEAENIVSSRPLTHIPVTSEEEEPLTPNHFLLGSVNSTQTPASPDDRIICLRKQWRIAQQLKNHFWNRWITEYLPDLTRRTKWHEKAEPLKQDDLVLICDNDLPRSRWQRGRIITVFPGRDGQVRSAEVKTSNGSLKRPASKLAKLDIVTESKSPERVYGGGNVVNRLMMQNAYGSHQCGSTE